MKIEKLCLSLLLLACLSLTATAWRPLPTLEDANPCEAADFLLAQQDFEAARLLYLKLLETPSSRACAQAGLLRLAEAQEQAAAAEKARLANLPRPLVPSLNVVGVQRCPSLLGRWLNCGTRWIGWPALLLPLANTDPASLIPHNALPTLLIIMHQRIFVGAPTAFLKFPALGVVVFKIPKKVFHLRSVRRRKARQQQQDKRGPAQAGEG